MWFFGVYIGCWLVRGPTILTPVKTLSINDAIRICYMYLSHRQGAFGAKVSSETATSLAWLLPMPYMDEYSHPSKGKNVIFRRSTFSADGYFLPIDISCNLTRATCEAVCNHDGKRPRGFTTPRPNIQSDRSLRSPNPVLKIANAALGRYLYSLKPTWFTPPWLLKVRLGCDQSPCRICGAVERS